MILVPNTQHSGFPFRTFVIFGSLKIMADSLEMSSLVQFSLLFQMRLQSNRSVVEWLKNKRNTTRLILGKN